MPADDLSRFCCQNPDCPRHGERGAGNLSVCDRFARGVHRLLYCNACKARFSEFKGTPLFNSKITHEKAIAILEHLAEGCGIRLTARLVGVSKDTVGRLATLAGRHAQAAHDELVAFSPRDPRGPARREVGVRGQEAEELRPGGARRRASR
ncbi:helix-turn-helix domain-containing protein [Singulisphaera sp. PoT]|uniref:helix-turn-helix domain-containing protein n=1 Tax=Singulisphaera sp. PoT TaxID=3411797 RepID=UPI003BF5AAFE